MTVGRRVSVILRSMKVVWPHSQGRTQEILESYRKSLVKEFGNARGLALLDWL